MKTALEITIIKFHIEKYSVKLVYEIISLTLKLIIYRLLTTIIHIKIFISLHNFKYMSPFWEFSLLIKCVIAFP